MSALQGIFESFRELFTMYAGTGFYMGLYGASLIYILAKGDKREKIVFLATPALLLLTALNPFLMPLTTTLYGGDSDIFYRFFWILPIGILLAYCAVKLVMEQTKKRSRLLLACTCILIFMIFGQFILGYRDFSTPQNPMKIPSETIEIVDALHEDNIQNGGKPNEEITVAVSAHHIYDIRSYDPSIQLVFGFGDTIGRWSPREPENISVLINLFWNAIPEEASAVQRALTEEAVDYIVFPASYAGGDVFIDIGCELVSTVGDFLIYRCPTA